MADGSTHGRQSVDTQNFDPVLTAQMDNEEECASMPLCQRDDVMKSLFGDETYTDVTIRCGDKDFKVHKCVICTIPTVFASFFKHDTKENQTNIIVHEEFDAATIQRLLAHVYTIFYSVSGSSASGDMLEHLQVYLAADYYNIGSLQTMALRRFNFAKRALGNNFEVAGFVELLSKVYKRSNLQNAGFVSIVFSLAMDNCNALLQDAAFMEELRSREELQNLAVDLLQKKTEQCARLQEELSTATEEARALARSEVKISDDAEQELLSANGALCTVINSTDLGLPEKKVLTSLLRCFNKECSSYLGSGTLRLLVKNDHLLPFCMSCEEYVWAPIPLSQRAFSTHRTSSTSTLFMRTTTD